MSNDDIASSHWESVYATKPATAVSWYRGHLDVSLSLLDAAGLSAASQVIDVGGGASTLVDDLLDRGVRDVSVLDLSASALAITKARLGVRAALVSWLVGDVMRAALPAARYTHWHDRAVMHFLVDDDDVKAYAAQAARAIRPQGYAVIGGFGPDGPARCSGLPVARRGPDDIAAAMGPAFELVETRNEVHRTPGGAAQSFVYGLLRRLG